MKPRCQPTRGLAPLAAAGLATLLLLTAPAADAQWRWRDANGRITASDLPPPHEIPDKDILQRPAGARTATPARPAPAPASAPSAPAAIDKDLQARKRLAEQEQQEKARAEEQRLAAARADNCARARDHLATMQSGQRIARMNKQGEREILDDQARAAEIRRARQVIASDCR